MKGFIKILESIIASIIILSTATFFLSFQKPSGAQQTQFEHILAALQKNTSLTDYIKSNDITALNTTLKDMLPKTVDFSVTISGIPNPVIKIACVCTAAEKSSLISRMAPLTFPYKSRTLEIRIDNGNLNDMADSNANILFFPAYRTFTSSERATLRTFLQKGTLFMLADLEQSQINDGVMDQLFGLSWGTLGAANGVFADIDNLGAASYRISRYYFTLGGGRNDIFTPKIPPVLTKNKITVDDRTIVGHPSGLPQTSLVKINQPSIGRTVWFVNYNPTLPPANPNTEMARLFKASMLWASGERYRMDPQFKIIPPAQTYKQYNYIGVLDGFEPFEISLKIWNIFF